MTRMEWGSDRDADIVYRLEEGKPLYVQFKRGVRKGSTARITDVTLYTRGPYCIVIDKLMLQWDGRKKGLKIDRSDLNGVEILYTAVSTVWIYDSVVNRVWQKPIDMIGRELTVGATVAMNAQINYRGMSLAFGRIIDIAEKGRLIIVQPFKIFGDETADAIKTRAIKKNQLTFGHVKMPPFIKSTKEYKELALYRQIALIDKDTLQHLMMKKLGVN